MSDELVEVILGETTDKMHKAVEHTRDEFASVRTGRASSSMVDKLRVEYYGTEVPLQQLAQFGVPEPRLLVISPHDKGSLGAIEKAIRNSDLSLNPSNDGHVIRLNIPALTEERRRELVRRVRHMAEEGKVSIRNLRRAGRHELEALEHDGDISEDQLARAEKELDRITHSQEADIDRALEAKEQELLEV